MQAVIAAGTERFIFDLQGHAMTEVDGTSVAGTYMRGEVFAPGRHVFTYGGNPYWNHQDWLGNERVRTDQNGNVVYSCSSLPFGDGLTCSPSLTLPHHFTGAERDAESGLDHFWFRQYSSAQGRWMMPDPLGASAADPATPQSWNRYAYVGNSPTNAVDPLGLEPSWNCPLNPACDAGPGADGGGGGWIPHIATLVMREIILELLENSGSAPVITTSAGSQKVGSETLGFPAGMSLLRPPSPASSCPAICSATSGYACRWAQDTNLRCW